MNNKFNRITLLGVTIDNIGWDEALAEIVRLVDQKIPSYIVTPNVDHLVRLQKDSHFREVYRKASLVLADGVPLLWGSKFLGTPIHTKVSGSDLLPRICEISVPRKYRLFFMGGREGAAAQAAIVLQNKYPGLKIVGHYCPPWGFEENEIENSKVLAAINEAKPDILLVGLGAPKQENWIYRYYEELNIPISIGIGVSFEFIAGIVKRAPLWMQRCGFEWLWRLIQEPKRLWKRYLIYDMEFFILLIKAKFQKTS